MSAATGTKKAVRGNPQAPVRIKFEHYLTPSYTEPGVTYTQNVRALTCTCPHWERHHTKGTPVVCKHLSAAYLAAFSEATEIARNQSSSHLAALAMKYHQVQHIKDACLFVLWERERETDGGVPGFNECLAKIGQLEGEIKEIVEERSTVTFSQSIAADTQRPEPEPEPQPETESDPRITAINDQIAALEEEIATMPYSGKQDNRRLNSLSEKLDRLQGRKKWLAAEGALSRIGQEPRSKEDDEALKELFR